MSHSPRPSSASAAGGRHPAITSLMPVGVLTSVMTSSPSCQIRVVHVPSPCLTALPAASLTANTRSERRATLSASRAGSPATAWRNSSRLPSNECSDTGPVGA